jgi:membrane fusion protein (multidrug efflux system)
MIPRPPLLAALAAAGALAALLASGCGANAETDAPAAKPKSTTALPVRVQAVGPGTVVETLAVQGRLEVWRREILAPRVSGVVQELPTLPNQTVKAGDTILRLQAPIADVEALAKAVSKLERAKRDLERRRKLAESAPETISIADLDLARDLVTDSELEVQIYQRREENRKLIAPFDGVLLMPPSTAAANTQVTVVGQQVSEGYQIAELLDLSRYRLSLDLPETNLRRLSIGQAVEIAALADGAPAKGVIAVLPRAIDAAKGSGRVLVDITQPPASWRPGGFITARLVLGETKSDLVLPRDCILYRENRPYVWVAEEHEGKLVVRRAWLDLGAGDAGTLVVLKGVAAGEQVVVEGLSGLSDGVPVSLRAPDGKPKPDADK